MKYKEGIGVGLSSNREDGLRAISNIREGNHIPVDDILSDNVDIVLGEFVLGKVESYKDETSYNKALEV